MSQYPSRAFHKAQKNVVKQRRAEVKNRMNFRFPKNLRRPVELRETVSFLKSELLSKEFVDYSKNLVVATSVILTFSYGLKAFFG